MYIGIYIYICIHHSVTQIGLIYTRVQTSKCKVTYSLHTVTIGMRKRVVGMRPI